MYSFWLLLRASFSALSVHGPAALPVPLSIFLLLRRLNYLKYSKMVRVPISRSLSCSSSTLLVTPCCLVYAWLSRIDLQHCIAVPSRHICNFYRRKTVLSFTDHILLWMKLANVSNGWRKCGCNDSCKWSRLGVVQSALLPFRYSSTP